MSGRRDTILFCLAMICIGIFAMWNELLARIEWAVVRTPFRALWIAFVFGAFLGFIL
jgi:hypothetical protein